MQETIRPAGVVLAVMAKITSDNKRSVELVQPNRCTGTPEELIPPEQADRVDQRVQQEWWHQNDSQIHVCDGTIQDINSPHCGPLIRCLEDSMEERRNITINKKLSLRKMEQ